MRGKDRKRMCVRVLTMSDSRQDTSCRTHGSRQFWFLFTFWSDVSVRICQEHKESLHIPERHPQCSGAFRRVQERLFLLLSDLNFYSNKNINCDSVCSFLIFKEKDKLKTKHAGENSVIENWFVLWCVQEPRYLLDLDLHGGGDGCGGDELEGRRGVVGILSGKLDHQVNLMAAEVSRHHAAAVHRVHLRNTKRLFTSLPV